MIGRPGDRDTVADLPAVDALDEDPFDDDLSERLAELAPSPVTRTTVALAGLVVLVAGFVGGVLVQKNFGATEPAATGDVVPNFPGGGAFPGSGTQGRGTQSESVTTGTVKLVDGTTVYITLSNGDIATVKTTGRTAVNQPATLKDLTVGQTVSVEGTAGSDGTITATTVTATTVTAAK